MNIGFWIFMLVMALLLPVMLIQLGNRWLRRPPQRVNGWYGYRTSRSMASQEAWDFAQRYLAILWRKAGIWMMLFTAAFMTAAWSRPIGDMGIYCCVAVGIQVVVLLLTILPVERALKRTFDRKGRRITKISE